MTLEQFSYVAQIVGVVLVIASLVYVAKQLRQNTHAVLAQSRQAVLTASLAEVSMTIGDPQMTVQLTTSDELTPAENVRLGAWLFATFRAREFGWLQHRNGVIDERQWQTELAVIRFFLDSTRVRDWWAKVGHAAYGDEFVQFVENELACSTPTDRTFSAMVGWTQA